MKNIPEIKEGTREADIQALCSAVLNASPNFWDNPNGAYENTCPFCRAVEYRGGQNSFADMSDIDHKPDCAYLIAKDLSTGLL